MAEQVLMSIRPRFADAILSGKKTVELRRRKPGFGEGTTVMIYASAPEQKVAGHFAVGSVISASPSELWQRVGQRSGVTKAEFDAYFAGCAVAHAIEIEQPTRLSPSRLAFRPPQSWQYLRQEKRCHQKLLALA